MLEGGLLISNLCEAGTKKDPNKDAVYLGKSAQEKQNKAVNLEIFGILKSGQEGFENTSGTEAPDNI